RHLAQCVDALVQECTSSFFFYSEDAIRRRNVTGVQTCALPIPSPIPGTCCSTAQWATVEQQVPGIGEVTLRELFDTDPDRGRRKIGRASCRAGMAAELADRPQTATPGTAARQRSYTRAGLHAVA